MSRLFRRSGLVAGLAVLVVVSGGWSTSASEGADARLPAACAWEPDPAPPEYYAIELVTTRRVVGTGRATGTAEVTFAPSPFGVALAPDGSYLFDVSIDAEGLPEPPDGSVFVAWLTSTDLSEIRRVAPLDGDGRARGRVAWNKFLVVITYEASPDPDPARWSGPVVLRGMSRSGMMHTTAGHGPFGRENCATYGY